MKRLLFAIGILFTLTLNAQMDDVGDGSRILPNNCKVAGNLFIEKITEGKTKRVNYNQERDSYWQLVEGLNAAVSTNEDMVDSILKKAKTAEQKNFAQIRVSTVKNNFHKAKRTFLEACEFIEFSDNAFRKVEAMERTSSKSAPGATN